MKYKDASLSCEERAEDLLSRMTVREKVAQMVLCGTNDVERFCEAVERGERPEFFGTFVLREYDPMRFNELQRYFVNRTRLGIPCLLAAENTHGVCNPHTAVYPTAGCLAATFREDLAYRMAKLSGREAYAIGIRQVYAPNVDVARDPRWGRFEENFGEDPFLSGRMGAAYVRGVQESGVAATVKHYIAYGVPEGGLNLAPAHYGERDIRNDFLAPFRDCIEAGAMSVMPAYNEIDGIPVHASRRWMVDVLREELGFRGLVVSDYDAIYMFKDFHHLTETKLEAGKIALANGIDVEACGSYGYGEDFVRAAENGELDMKSIDACVRRILVMKFRLGLFERPYAEENYADYLNTEEERALALEIAEQGIVLLQNKGVLPLDREIGKMAVIGPNADINEMGNYIYYDSGEAERKTDCVTSVSATLREALAARLGRERVLYAQGCSTVFRNEEMLAEAVERAKESDVVVLALGSNSRGIGGGAQENLGKVTGKCEITSGEGYDMPYIELPACQQELVEAVAATGKPVVMLLYGGRAHAVTRQLGFVNAAMQIFGAGEKGGEAIVNLLFGDKCPSGKLPFSIPRSTGHIPAFYNHKASARGSLYRCPGSEGKTGMDYVTDTPQALFPFGFGLSYTEFRYTNLGVKQNGGSVAVSVTVENCGKYDAYESVLLFLRCHYREVTPPVKELKGFKKVFLKAGGRATVRFLLTERDFSYYGEDMKLKKGKGKYTVTVSELSAEFTLT